MKDNSSSTDSRELSNVGLRNNIFLGLVSFFMNIASGMISSTVIFFTAITGLDEKFLTTVRHFFEASAQFLKIVTGMISDKIKNRKTFLLLGYGSMIIIKAFFGLSVYAMDSIWMSSLTLWGIPIATPGKIYGSTQFVERFLDMIRDIVREATMCDNSNKFWRSFFFGVRKMMACFGSVIGGLIAWVVLKYYLYKYINVVDNKIIIENAEWVRKILRNFYFCALIPAICSTVVLVRGVTDVYREANKGKKEEINQWQLMKNNYPKMKNYFILLSIMFLLSAGKFSDSFILQYARDHQVVSIIDLPLLFAVYYFQIGVASMLFSVLMYRVNSFILMLIGFVALPVFNIIMAFGKNHGMTYMVFATLILSFHVSIVNCNLNSVISKTIPIQELNATYLGLVGSTIGFAGICNSLVIHYLHKYSIGNVVLKIFQNIPGGIGNFLANNFLEQNIKYLVAIIPSMIGIILYIYFRKTLQEDLK